MRDRFLLRADVEGFMYRDVLEVRPGRIRLIRPSDALRRGLRTGAVAVTLIWLFLVGPLLFVGMIQLVAWRGWPDWLALSLASVAWVGGLVGTALWWDRRTLPVLADNAPNATDVKVLGLTSFWTFQEVRATAPQGEIRITVQGSRRKVGDILRSSGVWPGPEA